MVSVLKLKKMVQEIAKESTKKGEESLLQAVLMGNDEDDDEEVTSKLLSLEDNVNNKLAKEAEERRLTRLRLEQEERDRLDYLRRKIPTPPPKIPTPPPPKTLDEMVQEIVNECCCPIQFPVLRIDEGRYKIGDTKYIIYVRVC